MRRGKLRAATAALALAVATLWPSGCRPGGTVGPGSPLPSSAEVKVIDGLEVSASVEGKALAQQVGVPVRVRVHFRNVSNRPVSFGQESGEFPVKAKLAYREPFGDIHRSNDFRYGGGRKYSNSVHREQVIKLAPGEAWEREVQVTPKLPGSATMCLRITNPADSYWGEVKGTPYPDGAVPIRLGVLPMENPWKASTGFYLEVKIDACPDPKVTPSWEARRRTLASAEASIYDRQRALVFSDSERTSSAVGFLIGQVKALPTDSALRPFAVSQLVDMACAGYGFEAVDTLLDVAADRKEPEVVRSRIAKLLSLLRYERRIAIDADGNEGEFLVSDALRQRAVAILAGEKK